MAAPGGDGGGGGRIGGDGGALGVAATQGEGLTGPPPVDGTGGGGGAAGRIRINAVTATTGTAKISPAATTGVPVGQ
jgi:hypothetical protein